MQKYEVSIDLKKLPLTIRNKIVDFIKGSRQYYHLENQVIEIDFKTSQKLFDYLKDKNA